jgi:hypothetical protein
MAAARKVLLFIAFDQTVPAYWRFAVSAPVAFKVNRHDCVALPPLLHRPDQMAPFSREVCSVIAVPAGKFADAVLPLDTFNPEGLEVTVPEWPVTESVSVAVVLPPPQTLATPPPPHVWGDVQLPQFSVPPHPSEIDPQFFP